MSINAMAHCARPITVSTRSAPRCISKRSFSSTGTVQLITPESPRYIEVPQSLQTQQTPIKPIKGILPVPRQIVNKRKEYKATTEWLEQATPERARAIDVSKVPAHLRERTIYKRRMADMRRTNLRQGVSELYKRTVNTDRSVEAAREKKILSDLKALSAPRRHDETWTSISVSKPVRDALKLRSTQREEAAEERARRKLEVEEAEQAHKDDRLQSLHSLYLHAKDFITDEAQLDAEIDRIFGAEDLPMTWNGGYKSVWATGPLKDTKSLAVRPVSVHENLTELTQTRKQMQDRLMSIAGRLTGGKIPSPSGDSDKEHKLLWKSMQASAEGSKASANQRKRT